MGIAQSGNRPPQKELPFAFQAGLQVVFFESHILLQCLREGSYRRLEQINSQRLNLFIFRFRHCSPHADDCLSRIRPRWLSIQKLCSVVAVLIMVQRFDGCQRHPDEAGLPILDFLLNNSSTVAADQGIGTQHNAADAAARASSFPRLGSAPFLMPRDCACPKLTRLHRMRCATVPGDAQAPSEPVLPGFGR
jgi:hypothetical protein